MQLSTLRLAWASAAALIAILLWDLSGFDMTLALATGGPEGFSLREDWILTTLLHTGARYAAWLFVLALCLAVIWPVGALRRLPTGRRVQLAASALLASGKTSGTAEVMQPAAPFFFRNVFIQLWSLPHSQPPDRNSGVGSPRRITDRPMLPLPARPSSASPLIQSVMAVVCWRGLFFSRQSS